MFNGQYGIGIENSLGVGGGQIPASVADALPPRVRDDILKAAARCHSVEEVRLHCGRRVTLTVDGGINRPVPAVLTREETEDVLTRLCEGSVYAYRDTIREGYITLGDGVRVGVCGRAVCENGRVGGVYDISTLSIRIPHPPPACGGRICRLLEATEYTRGVMIYSPPGVGKTTLLRSLAARLSSGPHARRVAVVDTRGELACFLSSPTLCLDLLSGYPKEVGISIAARTLSSQVIICDEIGTPAEAEAIRGAHNCGVPLIATAHAGSVRELLGRAGMAELHVSGSFGAYVGIRRRPGLSDFEYDVCMREEVPS